MGRQFSTQHGATRVAFGAGASERIGAEVEAMGAERVLIVCTSRRDADARAIASHLGTRGTFSQDPGALRTNMTSASIYDEERGER